MRPCYRISPISALLIAVMMVTACAPPKPPPLEEKGLKLDGAMDYHASFFRHMVMQARVKVRAGARTLPWLKTVFRVAQDDNTSTLRITGLGPFGITVFDTLVDDTGLLLAVPRHKALYVTADQERGTGRRTLGSALWKRILNPWLFHTQPSDRVVRCPDDSADKTGLPRYALLCLEEDGILTIFDANDLRPLLLEASRVEVRFSGHEATRLTPPYPRRMHARLRFHGTAVEVEAKVLSLMPRKVPLDPAKGFERYMKGLEVRPLKALLRGQGGL